MSPEAIFTPLSSSIECERDSGYTKIWEMVTWHLGKWQKGENDVHHIRLKPLGITGES